MTRILTVDDLVALVERALALRLSSAGAPGVWRGELGRPADVIIVVTPVGIDFRPFAVEWRTPHDPVATSRPFVHLDVADVPAVRDEAHELIRHLAEATRIVRRGQYQTCHQCHQLTPPERMADPETCQDCAASRGGATF